MQETMKQMKERHNKEFIELRDSCPHNKVEILDTTAVGGSGRNITIRCLLCGQPIVGWEGREGHGDKGQVLYAKGFHKDEEFQ